MHSLLMYIHTVVYTLLWHGYQYTSFTVLCGGVAGIGEVSCSQIASDTAVLSPPLPRNQNSKQIGSQFAC